MAEKPHGVLTREEWRTLMITFVGGVASIVAGAAILGVVIAIGRWEIRHRSIDQLIGLAVFTVLGCVLTPIVLILFKLGPKDRLSVNITSAIISFTAFLLLVWIGIAAGVQ